MLVLPHLVFKDKYMNGNSAPAGNISRNLNNNNDNPEYPAHLKNRHDELSKDIRKVGLALLSFSFFCLITLSKTDVTFYGSNNEIVLPFAGGGKNIISGFLTLRAIHSDFTLGLPPCVSQGNE